MNNLWCMKTKIISSYHQNAYQSNVIGTYFWFQVISKGRFTQICKFKAGNTDSAYRLHLGYFSLLTKYHKLFSGDRDIAFKKTLHVD